LGEEAEGDFLVDEWVVEGVLFPFLPGGEDFLAAVGFQENGSAGLDLEVVGADLLSVDEGEGEAVCKEGAEFLHEIERKGVAAGAGLVEEAGLGIEADGFAGGAAVVCEEDVEKGEEGVGAIERGALGAALELEGGIVRG